MSLKTFLKKVSSIHFIAFFFHPTKSDKGSTICASHWAKCYGIEMPSNLEHNHFHLRTTVSLVGGKKKRKKHGINILTTNGQNKMVIQQWDKMKRAAYSELMN